MSALIVISGINTLIVLPILLNVVADIVLLACIIPRVVHLIVAIPNSQWCQPYSIYPGRGKPSPPLPDPKSCLHWKSVLAILIDISAGFTLLVWCVPFWINSAHYLRIFWRGSRRQPNTN